MTALMVFFQEFSNANEVLSTCPDGTIFKEVEVLFCPRVIVHRANVRRVFQARVVSFQKLLVLFVEMDISVIFTGKISVKENVPRERMVPILEAQMSLRVFHVLKELICSIFIKV